MIELFKSLFEAILRPKPKATVEPYPKTRPYASPPGGRRKRGVPRPIHKTYIPLAVMEATDRFMRDIEDNPREQYVWWGGYFTEDGDAQVVTAICVNAKTSYGAVRLNHRQLQSLQSTLRFLDQVLIAELHTHPPGAGGQNEVDAAHPAATYAGFITIVVPNYAAPRFYDLTGSYVYEYIASSRWRRLSGAEIQDRLIVEEQTVTVTV